VSSSFSMSITARLVARNDLPRIIGTSASYSMSMITKSTGNAMSLIFTKTSLIMALGCRIN
ncbi:hypothetical protein A2U01_0049244, partial [Trifolium medium]|nr:hypothetical protein [Trifolium medium]